MKKFFIKEFIKNIKQAKKEFGDPKKRCKKVGIASFGTIERYIKLILYFKWYYFLVIALLFVGCIHVVNLLTIDKGSYFLVALIGLFFQAIASFFFIKNSLFKNKYQMALESATYTGNNPEIVKAHVENNFNHTIGWMFLMIGIIFQFVALILSISIH
ncbi:MAG: hypothetical protein JSW08_03320 [archaeon]|nr:MAG: hypothetical protein JSW08_03320 [archaeon]